MRQKVRTQSGRMVNWEYPVWPSQKSPSYHYITLDLDPMRFFWFYMEFSRESEIWIPRSYNGNNGWLIRLRWTSVFVIEHFSILKSEEVVNGGDGKHTQIRGKYNNPRLIRSRFSDLRRLRTSKLEIWIWTTRIQIWNLWICSMVFVKQTWFL